MRNNIKGIQACYIKLAAYIGILFVLLIVCGCSKLVHVDPPITKITSSNVFKTDATAAAVMTNLYTLLSSSNYNSTPSLPTISLWLGLSADEFTLWSGNNNLAMAAYYQNMLTSNSSNIGSEFWVNMYPLIFVCNSAIEGLSISTELSPAVKQQLLGEAKFMRAFFYFYLVNLFGDIPLVLTSDYSQNSTLPRFSKSQIYQQIVSDLKDAKELLTSGYVDGSASNSTLERVRPNKWAATALLARTYLYLGDLLSAEAQSTAIINYTSLYNLAPLNSVFLKNSNEAIWQLQPVLGGTLLNITPEAAWFIVPTNGPNNNQPGNPVYLSSRLLTSFEVNDQRKINGNWINTVTVGGNTYSFPFKYKVNLTSSNATEYRMMLRLGEQYLIRAEARAEQGNIAGSQADLNMIRTRAGLSNTTSNDKATLLNAILNERQVELFTEMGQRWMDLKRKAIIDSVMTVVTPMKNSSVWNSHQQLFPLPLGDLQKDPYLTQNAGY